MLELNYAAYSFSLLVKKQMKYKKKRTRKGLSEYLLNKSKQIITL